jgi:hypothetical protein
MTAALTLAITSAWADGSKEIPCDPSGYDALRMSTREGGCVAAKDYAGGYDASAMRAVDDEGSASAESGKSAFEPDEFAQRTWRGP